MCTPLLTQARAKSHFLQTNLQFPYSIKTRRSNNKHDENEDLENYIRPL